MIELPGECWNCHGTGRTDYRVCGVCGGTGSDQPDEEAARKSREDFQNSKEGKAMAEFIDGIERQIRSGKPVEWEK